MRTSRIATAVLIGMIGVVMVTPASAAEAKTPKVLVIGLDGARYDKLLAEDTPNVHSLAEQGYSSKSTLPGSSVQPTVSGPGWSSVLTGVWADKHKVLDNSFDGNDLESWPSLVARTETANPGLGTYAAADWKPIGDYILRDEQDNQDIYDGDTDGYDVTDEQVNADAEQHLGGSAADASFVYFGETDHAGHEHGADSPEYAEALRTADARIGRLVKAVEERESYADEDWLILVTTDHGHTAEGGHGGDSDEERMTFVVGKGGALPTGTPAEEPDVVDLAPTTFAHLGIEQPDLDGTPLQH